MNFFNDRELALRLKNNQVPSKERFLYLIIQIILLFSVYYIGVIFIISIISMLSNLSLHELLPPNSLNKLDMSVAHLKASYDKPLSELMPPDSLKKLDMFVSSIKEYYKTPIKETPVYQSIHYNSFYTELISLPLIQDIICVLGIVICYKTNKAGDDKEFIERIICLGLPVGIRAFVFYILFMLTVEISLLILHIHIPYEYKHYGIFYLIYTYWRLNTSIKIASH